MATRLVTKPVLQKLSEDRKWLLDDGQPDHSILRDFPRLENQLEVVYEGLPQEYEFIGACKNWVLVSQGRNELQYRLGYSLVNAVTREVIDLPVLESDFKVVGFGFDVDNQNRPTDVICFQYHHLSRMLICQYLYNDTFWLEFKVGGIDPKPPSATIDAIYEQPSSVLVDSGTRMIWFISGNEVCAFRYPNLESPVIQNGELLLVSCLPQPVSLFRFNQDVYVVRRGLTSFHVFRINKLVNERRLELELVDMEKLNWNIFITPWTPGYAVLNDGASSSKGASSSRSVGGNSSKIYIANYGKYMPYSQFCDAECVSYDYTDRSTSHLLHCSSSISYWQPENFLRCLCSSLWVHGNETFNVSKRGKDLL